MITNSFISYIDPVISERENSTTALLNLIESVQLPSIDLELSNFEYHKKRRKTTESQLKILMLVFEVDQKPPPIVREALAKKLGMTTRAVQVWLQNSRAKRKKETQDDTQALAFGQALKTKKTNSGRRFSTAACPDNDAAQDTRRRASLPLPNATNDNPTISATLIEDEETEDEMGTPETRTASPPLPPLTENSASLSDDDYPSANLFPWDEVCLPFEHELIHSIGVNFDQMNNEPTHKAPFEWPPSPPKLAIDPNNDLKQHSSMLLTSTDPSLPNVMRKGSTGGLFPTISTQETPTPQPQHHETDLGPCTFEDFLNLPISFLDQPMHGCQADLHATSCNAMYPDAAPFAASKLSDQIPSPFPNEILPPDLTGPLGFDQYLNNTDMGNDMDIHCPSNPTMLGYASSYALAELPLFPMQPSSIVDMSSFLEPCDLYARHALLHGASPPTTYQRRAKQTTPNLRQNLRWHNYPVARENQSIATSPMPNDKQPMTSQPAYQQYYVMHPKTWTRTSNGSREDKRESNENLTKPQEPAEAPSPMFIMPPTRCNTMSPQIPLRPIHANWGYSQSVHPIAPQKIIFKQYRNFKDRDIATRTREKGRKRRSSKSTTSKAKKAKPTQKD